MAEIQEVVRLVKEEPEPLAQRRKPLRRNRSTDGILKDGTGCDKATDIEGVVARWHKDVLEDDLGPEMKRSMSTTLIIALHQSHDSPGI